MAVSAATTPVNGDDGADAYSTSPTTTTITTTSTTTTMTNDAADKNLTVMTRRATAVFTEEVVRAMSGLPRFHLVIANIQKISNVRNMTMAAVAFGCHSVLLVGQTNNSKRDNFLPPLFQAALDRKQIQLRVFAKWRECLAFMKQENLFLIGVEINETSHAFNDEYFQHHFPRKELDVGLLMGNEGQGILPHLLNGRCCISVVSMYLIQRKLRNAQPHLGWFILVVGANLGLSNACSNFRVSTAHPNTTVWKWDSQPECQCCLQYCLVQVSVLETDS